MVVEEGTGSRVAESPCVAEGRRLGQSVPVRIRQQSSGSEAQ